MKKLAIMFLRPPFLENSSLRRQFGLKFFLRTIAPVLFLVSGKGPPKAQ